MGSGGGDSEVTVGYKYYLGVHMVLCHGPVDKIVAIEVDNKEAWSGTNTGGNITIDAPNLFGGEDREGGISGTVNVDMGGPTQLQNAYLQQRLGSNIPAYRGVLSAVLNQVYIGLNPYLKRWGFWAERIHVRQNGIPQWYDSKAAVGNDMNPAHIIRECLTDPGWGMGYGDIDIDDTSFMAAADQMFTEGMGMSLLWDKGMPIEDFIKLVLKHIDASIYIDRNTGKFVLKLIRDDYVVGNLITLNEDNIDKLTNFKRSTVSELVNSVTVVYWDGSTGKNGSVTVQDIALAAQQKATISTTKQFPGFTNGELASRAASRVLKVLSTPTASATIYVNRSAADLNIGDVFVLSWARYGVTQTVMRVVDVELGTLENNLIKLSCIEDVFAISDAIYAAPPPSEWTDPISLPAACPHHSLIEAPYWEIVKRQGETEAQAKPDTACYALATGVRPSDDAINAKLWSDYYNGYEEKATVNFCPTAVIDENVSYTQTVIALVSSVDVDNVNLGSYALMGNEFVEVIAISSSEITVARGVLDTVPDSHDSGTRIYFVDGYYGTDTFEYATSEIVDIKLTPVTGKGVLDLSSAPAQNVTVDGRLTRPYPPGNMRLNGVYLAPTIGGTVDLVIDWNHRDRLQQTAGLIHNNYANNIGPEAGTTYTAELRTLAGALIASESGLTGTTKTFTEAEMGANFGTLRLLLWSVRDGFSSWQPYDFQFTRPSPVTDANTRYWKIEVLDSNSPDQWKAQIAEVELRGTPAGPDLTGSGTASASSFYGGFEPSKAFDDNTVSSWASNINLLLPQELNYDLGSVFEIQELALSTTGDPGQAVRAPTEFKVYSSPNNTTWTEVRHYTGESAWTTNETRVYSLIPEMVEAAFDSTQDGAWFDIQDINSMWQDDLATTEAIVGQPVGRIDDKSGNNRHLVQATGANKPILRQDGSNRYYLEYDGVNHYMTLLSDLTDTRSVLMAWEDDGTGANVPLFGDDSLYDFHGGSGNQILDPTNASANARNGTWRLDTVSINPTTTDKPTPLAILSGVTAGNTTIGNIAKDRGFSRVPAGKLYGLVLSNEAWDGVTTAEVETIMNNQLSVY